MDLSLDVYFQNKMAKNKTSKPSGILNRLGPKISPVRNRKQNNTQFKVTGLGNVKQGQASQQPKKVVKTITVGDARTKLNRNKPQDLRAKVNNLKARNTDARERIRARQGNNNHNRPGGTPPKQQKVVVTGLGQPYQTLVNPSGVAEVGGILTKTVKTTTPQQTGQRQGLTRTIRGGGGKKGAGAISVRVTPRQEALNNQINPVSDRPKVRIQNDHYVPPQHQQQPQRQAQVAQPAQYTGFEYNTPQIQMMSSSHQQQHQQASYIEPSPHHHPQQHHQPVVQPIMEPVLQQVIQPAYQPSFTNTATYVDNHSAKTFSEPDSGTSGYRVIVTNLHPIVTQDDLVELFGSIGALKKARLIKPGMAEIVYMSREDALSACKKYHMRELDGQPMQVNMTSLARVRTSPQPSRQDAPVKTSSPVVYSSSRKQKVSTKPEADPAPEAMEQEEGEGVEGPLRLGKESGPGLSNMDMNLVNKALFKTRIVGAPSRPVTFTVKI